MAETYYKLREFHSDWDIGFPRENGQFGAEVTVFTNRTQANDILHFMEWRLFHRDADLATVLPLPVKEPVGATPAGTPG